MLGGIEDPYAFHKGDSVKRDEGYGHVLNTLTFITIYWVTTPSSYTKDQLKAYKSLEAYKYVVDGWVSDVQLYRSTAKITGKIVCVVTGNVKHSQNLSCL